jgi:hypothetical protein
MRILSQQTLVISLLMSLLPACESPKTDTGKPPQATSAAQPAKVVDAGTKAQTPTASASAKPITIKNVGVMDVKRYKATVEAIDLPTRMVKLKGARGNVFDIQVSEEARNLAQVKVGDTVDLEYYEALAVAAKRTSGPTSLADSYCARYTP